MKVLLKKDIRGIGRKGEIKHVADGYFRNFLMPRELATPVTEHILKKAEDELKQKEADREKNKAAAKNMSEELQKHPLILKEKMDERGRLFGSVNARAIEQGLQKNGFYIRKLHGKIILKEPLKEKGTYQIPIQFPEGITGECTVIIEKQ